MNRHQRRAVASEMRKQATAWPDRLVPIPEAEWPPKKAGNDDYPIAVWRSRQYLAQLRLVGDRGGIEVRRLSVNRVTRQADGEWDENIPWEDLQRCKREAGYGDWYAVEVYPREQDLVNVANMRHLWLCSEPLRIGWFEGQEP